MNLFKLFKTLFLFLVFTTNLFSMQQRIGPTERNAAQNTIENARSIRDIITGINLLKVFLNPKEINQMTIKSYHKYFTENLDKIRNKLIELFNQNPTEPNITNCINFITNTINPFINDNINQTFSRVLNPGIDIAKWIANQKQAFQNLLAFFQKRIQEIQEAQEQRRAEEEQAQQIAQEQERAAAAAPVPAPAQQPAPQEQAQIQQLQQQIAQLQQANQALQQQLTQEQQEKTQAQQTAQQAQRQQQALQAQIQALQAQLQQNQAAQEQLRACQTELQTEKAKYAQWYAQYQDFENAKRQFDEKLTAKDQEITQLRAQLAAANDYIKSIKERTDGIMGLLG